MISVNYRHGNEQRRRCFLVDESGELVPADCQQAHQQRGAGDIVAAATKAVGIRPCEPCRKRQEAMNRATPGWAKRMIGKIMGG